VRSPWPANARSTVATSPRGVRPLRAFRQRSAARHENLVDQAVLFGFARRQKVVAIDVALDLLDGFATVEGDDFRHAARGREELAQMDLHVARRTPRPRGALMNHDLGARQRESFAARTATQDHGRGRHTPADPPGPY